MVLAGTATDRVQQHGAAAVIGGASRISITPIGGYFFFLWGGGLYRYFFRRLYLCEWGWGLNGEVVCLS